MKTVIYQYEYIWSSGKRAKTFRPRRTNGLAWLRFVLTFQVMWQQPWEVLVFFYFLHTWDKFPWNQLIRRKFLRNDWRRFIYRHGLKFCTFSNSMDGNLKAVIQLFKKFEYQDFIGKTYYTYLVVGYLSLVALWILLIR